MDWANERYIRLYTRDTLTWKLIGWEGRAVLPQILRKVDRSGVLELGGLEPADAVAAVIDAPIEMVRVAVGRLVERGAIEVSDVLVIPQFVEAQETSQSNAQRNREWRARRRDEARSARRNVTPCGDETSQERDVARRRETPNLPSPPSPPVKETVPNGTAKAADVIFGAGLRMLTSASVPEAQARTFLGRLRKDTADDARVAAAILRAEQVSPSDPRSWLRKAVALEPSRLGRYPKRYRTRDGRTLVVEKTTRVEWWEPGNGRRSFQTADGLVHLVKGEVEEVRE